jgi:SAM-dependent methyltransferase
MCNVACVVFGAKSLSREEVQGKRVLEVGARAVNGSLRPILEAWGPATYVGVDLEPGPGVDLICPAEALVERFGEAAFEVVVSTEVIEHVEDWRAVLSNMKRVLAPDGLLLLTTRSPGYPYHAWPHDFWRYTPEDMRAIFADFEIQALEPDPGRPGVFLKARRPVDFAEADLSGLALHSMVAGERRLALVPRDFRRPGYHLAMLKDRLKAGAIRLARRWL